MLESLVNDNEGLKRDNAELQSLLAESRDDLHALQQEVEERRADMPMKSPRSHAGTPLHANFGRSHHYSGSLSSSSMREHIVSKFILKLSCSSSKCFVDSPSK